MKSLRSGSFIKWFYFGMHIKRWLALVLLGVALMGLGFGYILREAYVRAAGDALGRSGGRIVAEVLVGIVDEDPSSYRAVDPSWLPTLPAAQDGSFGLADLLVFSSASAAV